MKKQSTTKLLMGSMIVLGLTPIASTLSAETLEKITITEDKAVEAEVSGGVVLDQDTLTHTPGTGGDPIRVLQTLPGVAVNDDTSAAPAIRGSRPEDNSYFVDFLPTGYLFHFGGGVSVFNEHLVKSFALYPSSYAARFSGGSGAVIDVALREPDNKKFSTTLDISFLKAGALIEGPITENQSFYLAGRVSYLDLLLEDLIIDDDDGVEFVQFPKFTDYQGKYLWKPTQDASLTLQLTGASDDTEFNLSNKDDDIRNEPDLVGQHKENVAFNSQGLVWKQDFAQGKELTVAVGHMRANSEDKAGAVLDSRTEVDTTFLKGRWKMPFTENQQLNVGGTVSQVKADYTINFQDPGCTEFEVDCSVTDAELVRSADTLKANVVNLYAEDSWFVNDHLILTGGLAYSYEDYLDKGFVEPRIRAEYMADDGWIFSAAAGQYHQFPGFLVSEKVFGNPQLDHESSTHYVMGAEKAFPQNWSLKTEIYRKQFDKLVTANPVTRYSNTGKGSADGFEILIRRGLTDRWSGWLSVSASNSERTNELTGEKFDFEFDQPVIASLVNEFILNDKWRFGMKWWFHSGAPNTPIIGAMADPDDPQRFIPIYGKINSERLPDYHRLDLRFDRQFQLKHADMSGYVELINAYGRKNLAGYDYNSDFSARKDIHQLPSIISFGLKIKF